MANTIIKSLKSESGEDRISSLPDDLIHRILALLPSTKEAVRTIALSKQWQKHWTRVPVLIFGPSTDWDKSFFKLEDDTVALHFCSKVRKSDLSYPGFRMRDPNFERIRFGTRKHIEDITLMNCLRLEKHVLPGYVFDYAFLVKVHITNCAVMPKGDVNWAHLKSLTLRHCRLSNRAVANMLSGGPLLESVEFHYCDGVDQLVMALEFMKRLALRGFKIRVFEISCPNLEELSIANPTIHDKTMFYQGIQNVLSHSLLLESLELTFFCIYSCQPVIALKSLRRLVIDIFDGDELQISCPKLEKIQLQGSLEFTNIEFINLPSSVCVTLLFGGYIGRLPKKLRENSKNLMRQLRHVKEPQLPNLSIEIFVGLEARRLCSKMFCVKCLTIHMLNWEEQQPGIACVLRNSPLLESLVFQSFSFYTKMDDIGENYWSLDANVFDCSVSHLKTVTFQGLPSRARIMLNLAQFLLKNARVLEKMVVLLGKSQSECVSSEDSQELFSYQRCSEYAIVEWITENVGMAL